jgi:hypothetical protein
MKFRLISVSIILLLSVCHCGATQEAENDFSIKILEFKRTKEGISLFFSLKYRGECQLIPLRRPEAEVKVSFHIGAKTKERTYKLGFSRKFMCREEPETIQQILVKDIIFDQASTVEIEGLGAKSERVKLDNNVGLTVTTKEDRRRRAHEDVTVSTMADLGAKNNLVRHVPPRRLVGQAGTFGHLD